MLPHRRRLVVAMVVQLVVLPITLGCSDADQILENAMLLKLTAELKPSNDRLLLDLGSDVPWLLDISNCVVVVLELENPKDSLRVSIPLACAKCSVRAWESSATVVSVVWFSVCAAT